MAQPVREPSARSEATRASILRHAERLFAGIGFDKARLEDIAEAVGIKRASIVYYYRDKGEVYDAVLHGVFTGFRERLDAGVVDEVEARGWLGRFGPLEPASTQIRLDALLKRVPADMHVRFYLEQLREGTP